MTPSLTETAALRNTLQANGFRWIPIYSPGAIMMTKEGPKVAEGKEPFGTGWQRAPMTDRPTTNVGNTGIAAAGLRIVDVDVDDAEAVAQIAMVAYETLGEAPMRFRENSPRIALLYRAAEGEPPKRRIVGAGCKVEILGKGQQLVVAGTHSTGVPLRWRPGALAGIRRDDLPAVTESNIAEFFAGSAPVIGSKGEDSAVSSGGQQDGARSPDADLVAAIVSGANYHDSLCALAARLIARGVPAGATQAVLEGIMQGAHADDARDARWQDRFASIPGLVRSAADRYGRAGVYRRELAYLTGVRLAQGVDAEDVLREAIEDAADHDIEEDIARGVVDWVIARHAGIKENVQ